MANWLGGFTGASYNREEFRAWLNTQKKPTFQSFITIHNTGAPYTLAKVGGKNRIINLGNYYKNEKKWKGGPHLFVQEDRVYTGTPLQCPTVHSPSWNNISLAIECEGDYDGTHDPIVGRGAVAWVTMAWAVAEVCEWLGWDVDDKHIRLHREDKATTHACPGRLVTKPWFIKKVQEAGGKKPTAPQAEPPAVMPIVANKPEAVYQPGQCKYSEYLVGMMKRVEGLRLKAYWDVGDWAIGYGHNATSKIDPLPFDGMEITLEQAEKILRVDLDDKLRYINTWVKVPLTQGNVDALCMYIFQQGPSIFRKKLLPLINQKMHWTTARAIQNQPHANPGVVRRRKLEADIYQGNKPTKW